MFFYLIQLTGLTSEPRILVFLTPHRHTEIKSLFMRIFKIFILNSQGLFGFAVVIDVEVVVAFVVVEVVALVVDAVVVDVVVVESVVVNQFTQ